MSRRKSHSSSAGSSTSLVMRMSGVRFSPVAPEEVAWLFDNEYPDDYPNIPVNGSHDKMSQAGGWGNRNVPKSKAHRQKLREANIGQNRKPHSDETKAKIGTAASKSNRKRVWTQEMRDNLSRAMKKSKRVL